MWWWLLVWSGLGLGWLAFAAGLWAAGVVGFVGMTAGMLLAPDRELTGRGARVLTVAMVGGVLALLAWAFVPARDSQRAPGRAPACESLKGERIGNTRALDAFMVNDCWLGEGGKRG